MSATWPKVRLGEVLRLDLNRFSIDPSATYPMVGVLSFGRGLFSKEPVENGKTSYKHFNCLKAEHIIMSQLFGWEGALALSNAEFAGKYLSPQFPTFLCEEHRLSREFLGWLMLRPTFWEDLGSRASGMGDRRRTLNPDALFACEIPLPPLSEQQRIVERIEGLADQIREAQGLRQEIFDDAENLLVSMAHRVDLNDTEKQRQGWKKAVLGEVISLSSNPCKVAADESYPNFGIYSFAKGLFHKSPIEGAATSATSLYKAKEGQFIYSRLFAFEGSYGYVTKDFAGCYVSNEYPMFDCQPGHVRAEFLSAYFKAPNVWREVAVGSKGLGDRRQRVQPTQVLAYSLWLPPIEWQDRIAAVWGQLNTLNATQIEAAAELDALLPAVLDKAFRGTLTIEKRP